MFKESVNHFQELSCQLLTHKERDALQKVLFNYQKTNDLEKLCSALKVLLNTPERSKLFAYIRAPMSRAERQHFDQLIWGNKGKASRKNYGRIATPPNTMTSSEHYVTIYGSRGESMGFSIRGGAEFGLGIYVSNIKPNSPAALAGLQVGDHVITANGVDLDCVANSGAVKVLSSSALLNLVVLRCGKVPEWKVAKERVLWFDVSRSRVVGRPPVSESPTSKGLPNILVEKKLVLTLGGDTDFIGLNIRGGTEYGIGIYVSRVDKGGLAARSGLAPGDQIVRVNDTDFLNITHTDAVDVLRSSAHLILTVRSVGKYPVFKELCAEYTWSDGQRHAYNQQVLRNKIITAPGRSHAHHTRESSIDQGPGARVTSDDEWDSSDLDVIEDLDLALQVESDRYPGEQNILFRRGHEDTWQDIESLKDVHSGSLSDNSQHSSDVSEYVMDYTTFLQQTRDVTHTLNHVTTPEEEEPVIETTVEEVVTDFTSQQKPRQISHVGTDEIYSQVTELTGKRTQSSVASSVRSAPIYATVNKSKKHETSARTGSDVVVPDRVKEWPDEEAADREILASQIEQLEARKSHLGSWEITKAAGITVNGVSVNGTSVNGTSSSAASEVSSDDTDHRKNGTWSSIKSRIKGSFRIKGSGYKKRSSIPSSDVFSIEKSSISSGSLRQKGVFERSFGSQILNTSSERYNLMGMLEDHARILLTEDECRAVIRHIHSYHDNKDLERLIQLLLEILDTDTKRSLLDDVRRVLAPSHISRFDSLLTGFHNNILHISPKSNSENIADRRPLSAPVKPARSGHQTNGKTGFYDLTSRHHEMTNRVPSFTGHDLKGTRDQLEAVIIEDDGEVNDHPVLKENEQIVYISKHKVFLGLELEGGRDGSGDHPIRIKSVVPTGAASDDQRLQPGVEVTCVNGVSVAGMSREEATNLLQRAFSRKKPTNLGIQIRP
ncbi:uncharacterized protein LOC131943776 [Physella acuta]|uniref:uncharacterized protein LOC131943776 n=1 Tax=Physella acuta TaxID=109671 RepID=UPI0027DCD1A4|nr:uncharacterized protein LOC131943776 [Physella acuta]